MNQLLETALKNKFKITFVLSILLFFTSAIIYLSTQNPSSLTYLKYMNYAALVLLIYSIFIPFWKFYSGPERTEQEINSFLGSNFVSNFYRVYFPILIFATVIYFLMIVLILNKFIDPQITPSGDLLYIVPGLVIGIGFIAMTDQLMRKNKLLYSPRGKKNPLIKDIGYIIPLMGYYFGFKYLMEFFINQIFGPRILILSQQNNDSIDYFLVVAARFWIFLSSVEKFLVPIGFLLIYIGLEMLLRGYIANEARAFGLGAAGMVFIPAVIQATAFSNAFVVFSIPILYIYTVLVGLSFGLVTGIILWKTKRFSLVVISALLMRLLDSSTEFFKVVMYSLPKFLGVYDPLSKSISFADRIGSGLLFIQISMIVFAPLITIIAYEEVIKSFNSLWTNFKKQWFGYIIIAFAFFLIDLVFSLISTGNNPNFILLIGALIVAWIVIMILLSFLFKLLPQPTEVPKYVVVDSTDFGEFPIDVQNDIKWIEHEKSLISKPRFWGILNALVFIYLLFISAAYRQLYSLNGLDIAKFIIFLVALPTALFGFSAFFLSRAYVRGYLFWENWRNQLLYALIVINIINLLVWTTSSSTAQFSWRYFTLFTLNLLVIWPKPVREPEENFTDGFSKVGRYPTFNWIMSNPKYYDEFLTDLLESYHSQVQIGIKIIGAKLNKFDNQSLIEELNSDSATKEIKIGNALALGILNSKESEGAILKLLDDDNSDVKIAAYWALGRVGSKRSLSKMSRILEENPRKELIKIAEKSILTIDPLYPLAGIRDSVIIE